MTRPEENLHLWKVVAEENNCFEKRIASRSRVTLMSGSPGAGKDTWLRMNRPDLPVVSLDCIRTELEIEPTENQGEVIQAAREQCREHLRAGCDFAFNATNITRLTRQRWIGLFADYKARIEIVYIEPPLQTILEQNKKRENPVPESVILGLFKKLDPPSITESDSLIIVDFTVNTQH